MTGLMTKWWTWLLVWLLGLGGLSTLTGCNGIASMPSEMGDGMRSMMVSMSSQAVWEQLQTQMDGDVIDPGMEVYGGVLYVGGARLKGVSGGISAAAVGHGTGELDPAAQAAILQLLSNDSNLDPAVREILLQLLSNSETSDADNTGGNDPGDVVVPE